jgi:hypothetical protein
VLTPLSAQANLQAFFERYGRDDTCSMLYALAAAPVESAPAAAAAATPIFGWAGHAFRPVADRALQLLMRFGGEPYYESPPSASAGACLPGRAWGRGASEC